MKKLATHARQAFYLHYNTKTYSTRRFIILFSTSDFTWRAESYGLPKKGGLYLDQAEIMWLCITVKGSPYNPIQPHSTPIQFSTVSVSTVSTLNVVTISNSLSKP